MTDPLDSLQSRIDAVLSRLESDVRSVRTEAGIEGLFKLAKIDIAIAFTDAVQNQPTLVTSVGN
jgi:hypothetical protein